MRYEEFVEEIQRRAGLANEEQAERVIDVTVRALGERLVPEETEALAAQLPGPIAARLRMGRYERDFDVEELYDRVARREGVARGFGVEHAQIVCRVLGAALGDELRMRLSRHLGRAYADLLEPRVAPLAPARPSHVDPVVPAGEGRTLASGRPGSRHPLSEAAADRAHAESVARSQDPHGDTKLSSSRGLTQERLGESLATGKPGPAHPVSKTRR